MRKILSAFIGVPVAIVLILFALANRTSVTVSLDPFAPEAPALSLDMPLFVIVFLALMAGVILGGIADWLRQGRYRREARSRREQVRRLEAERDHRVTQAPQPSGLPALLP